MSREAENDLEMKRLWEIASLPKPFGLHDERVNSRKACPELVEGARLRHPARNPAELGAFHCGSPTPTQSEEIASDTRPNYAMHLSGGRSAFDILYQ